MSTPPTVLTYHDPFTPASDESALLLAFKEQWTKMGWHVRVISPDLATGPTADMVRAHPAFKRTVNDVRYEMACWLRWVAWANYCQTIPQGAVVAVSDYDMLNWRLTPELFERESLAHGNSTSLVTPPQRWCGFAFARAGMLSGFASKLIKGVASAFPFSFDGADGLQTHVSDQDFMNHPRFKEYTDATSSLFVAKIGQPHWHDAQLVHLLNNRCMTRSLLYYSLATPTN